MLNFTIELARTNSLLERIARALEAAVGPVLIPADGRFHRRGPESIKNYGNNEKSWLRENFKNLVREKGLAPTQEQELIDQAMREFDQSVEDEAVAGPPE